MKYALFIVLMVVGGPIWGLLTRVSVRNAAVAQGQVAYTQGDATQAARAFAAALAAQAQRTPDPRLLLNLASAQTQAGQSTAAHATYGRLLAGTPKPLGSVARQQLAVQAAQRGEVAQALGLLRQALVLDPTNAAARYNYEVLSAYLAKRQNRPTIAPPPPKPDAPKPASEKDAADQRQPAEKAGTDRQGQTADPTKPTPPSPTTPPDRRANPAGQPDNQLPSPAAGTAAAGGRRSGNGPVQPLASGTAPGNRQGLDLNSGADGAPGRGRSNRPGTAAATPADQSLQTQRERLQAMNLSPAQARQLLETLRAQEQQYLQQVTRPAGQKPDPSKPTW